MNTILIRVMVTITSLLTIFMFVNCGSDDISSQAETPQIIITGSITDFGSVNVLSQSAYQSLQIKGSNLTENIIVSVSPNFEVSLNETDFSNQITIDKEIANAENATIYVRFSPMESAVGSNSGTLSLQSSQATTIIMSLSGEGISIAPSIGVGETDISFNDIDVMQVSDAANFIINGANLESPIGLNVTEGFEISLDGNSYTTALEISAENSNNETNIYVRFTPAVAGDISGILTVSNNEVDDLEIALSGIGLPIVYNYKAFTDQQIAFGAGFKQTEIASFNLHADNSNIEAIKMYVKLRCPAGGCDPWDVYANIKVKDTESGEWYEIGRYITPYGVDNSQLARGFEIDVTDFKSLLEGSTELLARIQTWDSNGWKLTVDFDYILGDPDYPYYAVSKVLGYDDWATSGVVYGKDASAFDLDKTVTIPANSESTHLRTIISGWGHATPADSDGRGCAEWCYRTHTIKINGTTTFAHEMGPIGCASNPVQPQGGNWRPDRAGWCPGMAVPVRVNEFSSSMAGNNFTFEYKYKDWTSDGGSTSGGSGAYYATSTFVVVKSSTPINKPQVLD